MKAKVKMPTEDFEITHTLYEVIGENRKRLEIVFRWQYVTNTTHVIYRVYSGDNKERSAMDLLRAIEAYNAL